MRFLILFARFVLGAIFLVLGLNKIFSLVPMPPPEGMAGEFMSTLAETGYFFPLLAIFEVLAGVLLLTGRFVPLALTLLAPIVVNIFAYHLFLNPSGLPLALLLVVLEACLAWSYRHAFRELLRIDVAPTRAERMEHLPPGVHRHHGPREHREARAH